MPAVHLRPSRPEDLAFVTALERHPDNRELIGQWSDAEHLAAMAGSDNGASFASARAWDFGHPPLPSSVPLNGRKRYWVAWGLRGRAALGANPASISAANGAAALAANR